MHGKVKPTKTFKMVCFQPMCDSNVTKDILKKIETILKSQVHF